MRGARPSIAGCAALAMAVLGETAGCARPTNPWVYAEPPAVKLTAAARPVQSGRTVVAVARFANPDVPQLDWPTVGAEMSSALRRSLYNETDFEVRIAPEIERADTDLEVIGEAAEEWMGIAQTFAGPPGGGRQPGEFPKEKQA